MKRSFTSFLITLLLLLTVSSIANANANTEIQLLSDIRLAPENGDPVVKEIRVQKYSDGSVKRVITGSGKHDDGPISLTINYDLNKNTYTTKRINISNEIKDQHQTNIGLLAPLWSKTLKVTTQDPVFIDLVYTKAFLWWYGENNQPFYVDGGVATWAANPTSLGTHWYVDDQSTFGYDDDGDGTVGQIATGYFHNYDFVDINKATYVYHTLELWGTATGFYDYRIESIVSGEGEALLHERVDII